MRIFTTIIEICVWCLIWAVGAWLFGLYETGKDHSVLIGIPYGLPTLVAAREVVKGTRILGLYGSLVGLFLGICIGFICFFSFMSIGSLTNGNTFKSFAWWISKESIWVLAGITSGLLAGLLMSCTRLISCVKSKLI